MIGTGAVVIWEAQTRTGDSCRAKALPWRLLCRRHHQQRRRQDIAAQGGQRLWVVGGTFGPRPVPYSDPFDPPPRPPLPPRRRDPAS